MLIVEAHQHELSAPLCGRIECQAQLLAVSLVAFAADCVSVMHVRQKYLLSAKLHLLSW